MNLNVSQFEVIHTTAVVLHLCRQYSVATIFSLYCA